MGRLQNRWNNIHPWTPQKRTFPEAFQNGRKEGKKKRVKGRKKEKKKGENEKRKK